MNTFLFIGGTYLIVGYVYSVGKLRYNGHCGHEGKWFEPKELK